MFPCTFWACQPIPRPHCDYLWGNRLWECVWEYRVPQCSHLAEVTFHCKRAHGKELRATCLVHKFQRWSKASTVRCEKTAIGCISKQLLGCTAFRPTERKMQILPSRFNIQVDTRYIPTFSRKFPHRPRLIRFLLQRWKQWWNRHLDVGLPSLWVLGPSIWSQGKFQDKNDLQASIFQNVCHSAHSMLRKLSSFKAVKASTKSVFSGLYLIETL